MPDFSLGGDGYYDYSAMSTGNDCGRRIMPGGDLNAKYLRFLDMIADFTGKCIGIDGEPIPMIFRPFHECNGNWFWWGAEYLTPDEYKDLFRYTIDYLCGERGVRNFAFCYSPNGPLTDRSAYISRYPGDEYVDIVGLDYYNDNPRRGDGFFKSLASSLDELYEVAQIHGKIPALTETGYRALETKEGYFEGLAPSGNANRKWFTDVLSCLQGSEGGRRCAYMLIWANFSDQQFWLPYVKGEFRHEMCDNLEAFAADPGVVMAPVEGLT
jgi:mannan endo-1,4-beta-mannosidase